MANALAMIQVCGARQRTDEWIHPEGCVPRSEESPKPMSDTVLLPGDRGIEGHRPIGEDVG